MPTTEAKNRLYRMALPFLAPGPGRNPEVRVSGHRVEREAAYRRLLRRHHVLGSAGMITAGDREAVMLSSSEHPKHIAERDTMFRVASITKMATALCVMQYAEAGSLDPDQPIFRFFPAETFSEKARKITARQLLSHTAGLLDPPDLENCLLRKIPFLPVMEKALQHEPGAEFHYSNLGFGMLGCVLEAIENRPVSRILQEKVFDPLGMNATLDASALRREKIMPVARVLRYWEGREVTVTALGAVPLTEAAPMLHYGHTAGSMYTDIDSLQKLVRCLREDGSPLLSPETGREMKRQHAAYGAISPTLSYGLGILIIRDPRLSGGRILGHQGFAYGCADGAFWEEETGNTVLFLNGGCSEAREGRLGLCNFEMLRWALQEELPGWR